MTEQSKAPAPAQEHQYPPPVLQYAQPYNGPYPPPPPPGTAPYPPYFYPPPAEGSHGENGQNGMPPGAYMMLAPPGVVYVHPPPPQGQPFPTPSASAAANQQPAMSRPKRKQVKMACTNCAAACKRCDEARPCERCQKYGIADSCIDGQRKERKKGIKRGPYKRKNKGGSDSQSYNGEWAPPPPGSAPPTNGSAAPPPIHAVPTQLPPEGYPGPYPIFYPPPYMAHPPEGQPGPDGAPPPPHVNGGGQPPVMQYYIHHPGAAGYAPYGHHYPPMYPHPGPPPQQHPGGPPPGPVSGAPPAPPNIEPPPQQQMQTVNPVDTSKKDEEEVGGGSKKRRGGKAEGKGKRSKVGRKDRDGEEEEQVADML